MGPVGFLAGVPLGDHEFAEVVEADAFTVVACDVELLAVPILVGPTAYMPVPDGFGIDVKFLAGLAGGDEFLHFNPRT